MEESELLLSHFHQLLLPPLSHPLDGVEDLGSRGRPWGLVTGTIDIASPFGLCLEGRQAMPASTRGGEEEL